MTKRTCSVDGCGGELKSRGYCNKHYRRWLTHGDVHHERDPHPKDRLLSKVDESPDGCWLYTGQLNRTGYGRFWFRGRETVAHRAAYELWIGPIPDGLQLDHLCRVRHCVNPDHLEPVTAAENQRRAVPYWNLPDACPQGHPYDEANTYRNPSSGHRMCRACHRAHVNAAKTHCKYGHPLSGDNVRLGPGGVRRQCIACADRTRPAKTPTEGP